MQKEQEQISRTNITVYKKNDCFCNEHNIEPTLPFMINISFYFGKCDIDDDILNQCNCKLKEIIKNSSFSNSIIRYYLQLALLVDQKPKYAEYMKVYEPLVILFEQGGSFVYRERGMSFMNSGLIPLSNWHKKFKDKSEKSMH